LAEVDQERATSGAFGRFVALYVVSFVSMGLAEPHRDNAFVAGGAVVPAIIAWLLVRKKPAGLTRALVRGASIVLIIAGFAALGSVPLGENIENVTGAGGLALTSWAYALLGVGVIGLFGSLLGERRERNIDAQDR
jgi:hypothetical protein